jgi:uncharacterized membrane protein YdbT with pleckstrin-like domain
MIPQLGRSPSDRYLLPSERRVVSMLRHPVILWRPMLWLLGALILAGWVDATIPDDSNIDDALWWGVLIVAGWSTVQVLEWVNDLLIVTDKRILTVSGLVTRKVAMMPLPRVTDMTYERSWPGRVFGYGEFIVESAGQDQALSRIPYIPRPDAAYRQIAELLFGTKEEAPAKKEEPAAAAQTSLPVFDPDATQPLYLVKERTEITAAPIRPPTPPPPPRARRRDDNSSGNGNGSTSDGT